MPNPLGLIDCIPCAGSGRDKASREICKPCGGSGAVKEAPAVKAEKDSK